MRFVYSEEKAAQAAAYLIKLHGGQINVMSLIKLLYFADRKALIETGLPITGDKTVSMPNGPVLSRILDNMNYLIEDRPWNRYISERNKYEVKLVEEPSFDELSDYEVEILESIFEKYGHLNQWELRDLSHKLPEWKDPDGSSIPIDPMEILKAGGRSDGDIREMSLDAEETYALATFRC